MSRTDHFKLLIAKYPFPLQVNRDAHPKPHKIDVPYHYAYVPLPLVGRFFLFLTPQDRDDFAKRYALKKRTIKQWPPAGYEPLTKTKVFH